jgi:nucleotide-binding universal stress UspA family protein
MRLVHVRNPVEEAHNMDLCLVDNGKSLSVQSRSGAYLEGLAESLSKLEKLRVAGNTVTGVSVAHTLRSICKENARILVMSRTRRSALSRVFLGGVTDRLIGGLTVPLLLVPDERNAADSRNEDNHRGFNRMLVYLNGADTSDGLLDIVRTIASKDAICHLLRVLPMRSLNSAERETSSHGCSPRDKAWLELLRAKHKLKQSNITCKPRLIFNRYDAVSTVAEQVKATRAQVVVVTAREHLLPWWLRTDVPEYLVRHVDVPVLIVPANKNVVPPGKANHVDIHSN